MDSAGFARVSFRAAFLGGPNFIPACLEVKALALAVVDVEDSAAEVVGTAGGMEGGMEGSAAEGVATRRAVEAPSGIAVGEIGCGIGLILSTSARSNSRKAGECLILRMFQAAVNLAKKTRSGNVAFT